MELVEFDGADGVAQFGEHAASADGCELVRVADEDESPSMSLDVVDEAMEVGGVQHPGFVDDEGGAGRESGGDRVGTRVVEVVDQLGDGVGFEVGFPVEDLGASGGRGDAEDRSTAILEVEHGGVEHSGLAGAGGPDDDHELILPGDG